MPKSNHVETKSGDVLLLAGTMKGAFVLRSDKQRQDWRSAGLIFRVERFTLLLTTIATVATASGPQSIAPTGVHT